MSRSGPAAVLFLLVTASASGASFVPLGDLGGGEYGFYNSAAYGVSGDGSVVVGRGLGPSGREAFRWTSASGMVGLGDLNGGSFDSQAFGVSDDGSVVVGYATWDGGTRTGARWTSGGLFALCPAAYPIPDQCVPNSPASIGYATSADGSVTAGVAGNAAYVWSGNVPGTSLPSTSGEFFAVSPDGAFAAGVSGGQAIFWQPNFPPIQLGDLPGGAFFSEARDLSTYEENLVVVGRSISDAGMEAFRWTPMGGMIGLGDFAGGGFLSEAYGISADGGVVVGRGEDDWGSQAFVWTAIGGMQKLYDVLVANGATGLSGWNLIDAYGVSADGKWVVGRGWGPNGNEAFLANIELVPVPVPAAIWLFGGAVGILASMRRHQTR